MPRPSFEVSPPTLAAVERLSALAVGETVKWEELSRVVGEDAQASGRHHIDRARVILLRERQMVLEAVPGYGIKHLTPAEKTGLGLATIRKINRAAHRGGRKLRTMTAAEWQGLTHQEQLNYTIGLSMLDVLGTKTHSSNVVAARQRAANADPVFRPDFDAFKNS